MSFLGNLVLNVACPTMRTGKKLNNNANLKIRLFFLLFLINRKRAETPTFYLFLFWLVGFGRCFATGQTSGTGGPVDLYTKSPCPVPSIEPVIKEFSAVDKHWLGSEMPPNLPRPPSAECDRSQSHASRPNHSRSSSPGPVSRPLAD
ncbi:hypothetical protein pqer_cds_486 [Pandoravirus quercus]|uniref:Uncharacterized protein n=1 Tax=Pandoravirus quercus TaxID=2107709 RepID=A0A2U7U8X9_9VIRU|nr:hypothetical protein pqer_cds_486 [Pandoravirus quercus]AVK74908.1 hypothetical protein pqer_cds_486 [Pandoravirus quercus]